jgi:hypothetical protein
LTNRWWKVFAFGLLMAALFVIGYWRMFTQFMVYDDEGCFLWSLGNYCSEGGLYDRLESWYGPFFFAYNRLLHALGGLTFNHDTGRLLTLLYWCGTVLICGLVGWKQTRSLWTGLAAAVLTFVCLITVIREPMHPSGFLTLAVALAVITGAAAIERGRPLAFAGMAALLGTAMALSKTNVGAFFLIAAGAWLAINSRAAAHSRAPALLTAFGCTVVPFLLMRAQWPNPSATAFVLVFACGALALTAALQAGRQPEHGITSGMVAIAIGLAFGGLVLVAASAQGTSWHGLWKGVVAAPKGFAQAYYVPSHWPSGARELAIIQLLAAAAYYFRRRAAWVSPAIAALRLVAGVWFFARLPLLFSDATSLQNFCFSYGPSLAWLMVVPLTSSAPTAADRARLWLAWVFVWQTLQAFPVPGSQIGWGSFLWAPLFVVGWHEAVSFWAERLRLPARVAPAASGLVLASMATLALWPIARMGCQNFTANEPLGLPGSSRLRLGSNIASDLRILQQNIRAHGGLLFTYPLMPSFNLWTGCRPPTLPLLSFNLWTGHRPANLPQGALEACERALFEQLQADPRAVFVVSHYWIELAQLKGGAAPEALFRYLNEHFVPVLQVDSYGFWVHRGRPVALYSIARLLPTPVAERLQLEFSVEALAQPLAALEFVQLNSKHDVLQRLPLDAAQPWQRAPVSDSGATTGEAVNGTGPIQISQPSRLVLPFAPAQRLPGASQIEVRLMAADGQILGRLRFADKLAMLPMTKDQEARGEK